MVERSQIHPLRWADTMPIAHFYIHALRGSKSGAVSVSMLNACMSRTMHEYNRAIEGVPFDERPSDIRLMSREVSLAMYAARFFTTGKNVIEMSLPLLQALDLTTLGDVRFSDIKLPHRFFWVSLANAGCGGLPGPDNRIDGAYVDATLADHGSLQIVLTTRRADLDPSSRRQWPMKTDSYFYIPCSVKRNDQRNFEEILEEAVQEGEIKMSEEFARDLAMPSSPGDADIDGADVLELEGREMTIQWKDSLRLTKVIDQTRENDLVEIERNRVAMPEVRRALSLVVNLLAYMSLPPSEITTEYRWPDDAPERLLEQARNGRSSGARQRAEEELVRREFNRIKVVGLKPATQESRSDGPTGIELQFSHMRIGHFRTQPYGPRNSLRKLIWVRPLRVRPDLELRPDGGGHHYVVEDRETNGDA